MLKRNLLSVIFSGILALLLIMTTACHFFHSGKEEETKDQQSLVRLQELMKEGDSSQALPLFKTLEPRLTKGIGLYKSWLFFALHAGDLQVRKEYGQRFLNETNLTRELAVQKSEVYRAMAMDAREAGDLSRARELLQEGIQFPGDAKMKQVLESDLAQMDLFGQTAPLIAADTWLNESPENSLSGGFNGKPALIAFRAPWSEASRKLTGTLKEIFAAHQAKGLIVADIMKLYGFYKDAETHQENISAKEELDLLKTYVKNEGIGFPVAIANEGLPFEAYNVSVLPALFFIDKQGNISNIETGSGSLDTIVKKVKKILEEN